MPSPQTHVMDVVQSVHGLQCGTVSLEANTTLRTRFMGWGPSLHRTGLNIEITPPTMDPDDIAAAIEPYLAVQVDRRRRAGIVGVNDMHPEVNIGIRHLVSDRLVRALALELTDEIRSFGQSCISSSIPAQARIMRIGNLFVEDGPEEDVRPRAGYVAKLPWGWFDGADVTIDRPLPETAIALLAGRTVGDVIDTSAQGPHIAELGRRVILEADTEFGRPVLTTASDWFEFVA